MASLRTIARNNLEEARDGIAKSGTPAAINIALTPDEISILYSYILITTDYRRDEEQVWRKLASEKKEDGQPRFPNALSNADYYQNFGKKLDVIAQKLDSAH